MILVATSPFSKSEPKKFIKPFILAVRCRMRQMGNVAMTYLIKGINGLYILSNTTSLFEQVS